MSKQNDIFSYYKKQLTDAVLKEVKNLLSINIPEKTVSLIKDNITDNNVNEYMTLEISQQKYLIKSAIEYKEDNKIETFTSNGEVNSNLPDDKFDDILWGETTHLGEPKNYFFINNLANEMIDLFFKEKDIILDTVEKVKEFMETNEGKDLKIRNTPNGNILVNMDDFFSKDRLKKDRLKKEFVILPHIYMEYIKTVCKENIVTEETVKNYNVLIEQYGKLFQSSKEQGLEALSDSAAKQLAMIQKEVSCVLHGCNKFIEEKNITSFISLVQSDVIDMAHPTNKKRRVAYFKKYEEFPRLIPNEIFDKKKIFDKMNIFNEYWILFLDYSNQELEKSVTGKLSDKQKDPILFGKISKESNKLYFIADWIDEVCDLTLDKLAEKMSRDKEFSIEYASSPKNVNKTIKGALAHHEQNVKDLNTGSSNLGSVINRRQSGGFFSEISNFFGK